MKCHYASFNVGNLEVWSSDLFRYKKDVIQDVETSFDIISDELFQLLDLTELEITKILNQSLKSLKNNNTYRNKEYNLDFFILEQRVWKNIIERETQTNKIKVDNGTY